VRAHCGTYSRCSLINVLKNLIEALIIAFRSRSRLKLRGMGMERSYLIILARKLAERGLGGHSSAFSMFRLLVRVVIRSARLKALCKDLQATGSLTRLYYLIIFSSETCTTERRSRSISMNCPSSTLMAARFHGIIGDDKLYFNLLIRETTNRKILFIL